MYFSDIVAQLKEGNFDFKEDAEYVFTIVKSKYKVAFDFSMAAIIVDGQVKKFGLSHFSDFSFKTTKSTQEGIEDSCSLLFAGEELFSMPESKMEMHKKLFSSLSELFTDDEQCSPKFQIDSMKNLCGIDFSEFGEQNTNKLLLLYKERFETIANNEFIKPNTKLLMFLEQDSGKISQNLGQTAKKNLKIGKLLGGGFSGLIETGIGLAKAAGSRMAQVLMNNFIGDKDIMLLTDKNVIVAKKETINEYDFDDAIDLFRSKQDEVLAGVVDIYDDCENLVLDNISQVDWNVFKTTLRKLRKDSEHSSTSEESSVDAIEEIENKLMKLKSLVEKGLLSQEDFETKKADLLASL